MWEEVAAGGFGEEGFGGIEGEVVVAQDEEDEGAGDAGHEHGADGGEACEEAEQVEGFWDGDFGAGGEGECAEGGAPGVMGDGEEFSQVCILGEVVDVVGGEDAWGECGEFFEGDGFLSGDVGDVVGGGELLPQQEVEGDSEGCDDDGVVPSPWFDVQEGVGGGAQDESEEEAPHDFGVSFHEDGDVDACDDEGGQEAKDEVYEPWHVFLPPGFCAVLPGGCVEFVPQGCQGCADQVSVDIFQGSDKSFVEAEQDGDGASADARDDVDASHGHAFEEDDNAR